MFPIKRILYSTDFSEASLRALKIATALAEQYSAELILVHVVYPLPALPSPAGLNVPAYQRELKIDAERRLQKMVVEEVTENVKIFKKVVIGENTSKIITDMAASEKADLIVIATHGRSGWQRFTVGSVAEKVVKLASCSVLTIPASFEK